MTNETALQPCPFCGASASGHAIEPHAHSLVFEGVKMPDHAGGYVIEDDCACGSGLIGDTQEEVTARWNRRSALYPASLEAVQRDAIPLSELVDELEDDCNMSEKAHQSVIPIQVVRANIAVMRAAIAAAPQKGEA